MPVLGDMSLTSHLLLLAFVRRGSCQHAPSHVTGWLCNGSKFRFTKYSNYRIGWSPMSWQVVGQFILLWHSTIPALFPEKWVGTAWRNNASMLPAVRAWKLVSFPLACRLSLPSILSWLQSISDRSLFSFVNFSHEIKDMWFSLGWWFLSCFESWLSRHVPLGPWCPLDNRARDYVQV